MAPPHVDGAHPHRAGNPGSPAPGTMPRPSAAAIERSKAIAAQFAAQVEFTMLQSLSSLSADSEDADGGEDAGDEGGGDLGLDVGMDQQQLMATLFTGAQKRGTSAAQLQALMSAYGGQAGASGTVGELTGAGAGDEAQLAQQLLASLGTGSA